MLLLTAVILIIVAIAYWIRIPIVNSFLSFGKEVDAIIYTACAFTASILVITNLVLNYRRESKDDKHK